MFQKALKSKNEAQREAICQDKKAIKAKKFNDNDENIPKENMIILNNPNPSKVTDPLTLIEIHKSKTFERRDLHLGKANDKHVRNTQSKSNRRKGLSEAFSNLKEVKSFPLPIPPWPSKTDFALKAADSNRASKNSQFKIKQQSKTSFKLPGEEVARLSSTYSRLREEEVKRPSKGSHTQIKQVSKTIFKLAEEETKVSFPESRHYSEQSSKTSFKFPTQGISQKISNVSFKLPTDDPQNSHNPQLIQLPTLRGNERRSSSTAGRLLTTKKTSKKTSKTILKTTSERKLQSSDGIDKKKYQLLKTTSKLSLRTSKRSSPIQTRRTLHQSTSKPTVHKSLPDLKKSTTQQLHRIVKSISSDGLRKIPSKTKRKSKKGKLKESAKIPYPPPPTTSTSFQQRESVEDDSNLPEELQLMRFVKKLNLLLKVLKKLRESHEKRLLEEIPSSLLGDNDDPVEGTLKLAPIPLENREATEDRASQFRQIVGEILEPKPKEPTELQKDVSAFARYILKRSNPYSGDVVNPMAKRFKTLLAEVSSGSSSEGYIEWKSLIWNKYQKAKSDETLERETSETESSSSLDEDLQNVGILKWQTSFEDVSADSVTVPQIPEIETVYFPIRQEPPHVVTEEELDKLGKFVDPLTGVVLITPPTSTSSLSIELGSTGDEDREEEEDGYVLFGQSLDLEDLDIDESLFQAWDERYDKIHDEVMRPTLQSEEQMALSLFIEQSRNLQLEKRDEMSLKLNFQKAPTIKEILPQMVNEFLDSIITKCVLNVEKMDSQEILRKSLCKRKLLRELHTLLCERDQEHKLNNRLKLRVVDYLRRRNKLSLITEMSPRLEKSCRERYYYATQKLDKLLMRMEEARVFCKQKVTEESELCAKWMEKSTAAIEDLEQFIKTSVKLDQHQEKLPQSIECQLRKMAKARKETSESRYKLMQLQHLHCKLTLRSTDIQSVGNGLSINNLERLYSEIQNLTKQNKVQEAKNNRLRKRCSKYIEQVAHIRDQISMTLRSNEGRRLALDDIYDTVRWQRQKICAMKSQHNKIRQMVSDLKWRGGIMDKPLLMFDYDETVKRIQELRGEIECWKQQSSALEPQIKAVEEKCFRVAHK